MRHPRFVAADDTFPQWQLPSGVREVYVELEGEPLLLLEGASLSVTALEKAENRLVAWRTFESSERNYTMPIPPDCGVLGIADVNISRCVHTYGGACDVECRKGFVGEVSAQCDSDGTVSRWNSSGECVAVGPCFVMGSNKKGHLGLSRGDKQFEPYPLLAPDDAPIARIVLRGGSTPRSARGGAGLAWACTRTGSWASTTPTPTTPSSPRR